MTLALTGTSKNNPGTPKKFSPEKQLPGSSYQFPSAYTMEAYPPSGFPYLGEIATLFSFLPLEF